jgi:hypothetical protein
MACSLAVSRWLREKVGCIMMGKDWTGPCVSVGLCLRAWVKGKKLITCACRIGNCSVCWVVATTEAESNQIQINVTGSRSELYSGLQNETLCKRWTHFFLIKCVDCLAPPALSVHGDLGWCSCIHGGSFGAATSILDPNFLNTLFLQSGTVDLSVQPLLFWILIL